MLGRCKPMARCSWTACRCFASRPHALLLAGPMVGIPCLLYSGTAWRRFTSSVCACAHVCEHGCRYLQPLADELSRGKQQGERAGGRQWSVTECERLRCCIKVLRRSISTDESLVQARHLLAKAWLLLSRALAAGSVPPWQCYQGAWDETWRRGVLSRCFPDAVEEKRALAAASFVVDKQVASGDAHQMQEMQGARMMLQARRNAVSLMKEVVEADGGNTEARLLVRPKPALTLGCSLAGLAAALP